MRISRTFVRVRIGRNRLSRSNLSETEVQDLLAWWEREKERPASEIYASSGDSQASLSSIDLRYLADATRRDQLVGVADRMMILDYLREQLNVRGDENSNRSKADPILRFLDKVFRAFRPNWRTLLSRQQLWRFPLFILVLVAIVHLIFRADLQSPWVEITIAAALVIVFWLPDKGPFATGYRIYFRKPNPLLEIYRSPSSRHWVKRP
jgi:hypothetical protein